VDKVVKYKPIYSEFGPLNMFSIHKFCKNLQKILKENPSPIIHFTQSFSVYQVNSALLIGAFMIFILDLDSTDVEIKFERLINLFIGYKDISKKDNNFRIFIQDCWRSLDFMKKSNLFLFSDFD